LNYKTLFYLCLFLIVFFSIAPQEVNSARTFNIYDLLANLAGVLVVKILFDQKRRVKYGNC